jgi:hypothetical protein
LMIYAWSNVYVCVYEGVCKRGKGDKYGVIYRMFLINRLLRQPTTNGEDNMHTIERYT